MQANRSESKPDLTRRKQDIYKNINKKETAPDGTSLFVSLKWSLSYTVMTLFGGMIISNATFLQPFNHSGFAVLSIP